MSSKMLIWILAAFILTDGPFADAQPPPASLTESATSRHTQGGKLASKHLSKVCVNSDMLKEKTSFSRGALLMPVLTFTR